MTEYYPGDYPPLSHLIQTLEAAECAKLYPTRATYQDEYSSFANYAAYERPLAPQSAASLAAERTPQRSALSAAVDGYQTPLQPTWLPPPAAPRPERTTQLELDSIAKRKAELERSHQMALQRIAELQRAKEAKALAGQERPSPSRGSNSAAAPTATVNEGDDVARKRAEKDAELQRMQRELESRLREQETQRQRLKQQRDLEELEKQRKEEEAAEAKRVADEAEARRRANEAELQRREAEQRAEDARLRAAEARERQRQQQLADELARQRRDAAVEAKRQATLARELAEQKRALRVKKQRQAVMRLRFHLWRKYVRTSKALPPPVKLDATRFVGSSAPHVKPKSAIQWLFKDATAASSVGTKLRHPSEVMTVDHKRVDALSARTTAWCTLDVLSLVGPALSAAPRWKLVLSDLVDNQRSSFGVWCAAKLGVTAAAPVRVFQSPLSDVPDTVDAAVCCRYVSAATADTSNDGELKSHLSGASALLLTLSLSEILETGKRQRWLRRLERLCTHLAEPSRVVASVLLFANVPPSLQSKRAVDAVEACVRELHAKTDALVDVEFTLVSAGDNDDMEENNRTSGHTSSSAMISELTRVLQSLARRWVALSGSVVVKLEELLESSLAAAINRCAPTSSPARIQDAVQTSIRCLREDLEREWERQAKRRVDAAIPELEDVVCASSSTRKDAEAQKGWEAVLFVLTTLATERVDDLEGTTRVVVAYKDVCSHFFTRLASFVDRLFATAPSGSPLAARELQLLVHALLVPVHERFVSERRSRPIESSGLDVQTAAAKLPWTRLFVEVYTAFFETLKGLTVSVSEDWRSQRPREVLTTAESEGRARTGRMNELATTRAGRLALSSEAAATVAVKSLKRSFGVALVPTAEEEAAASTYKPHIQLQLRKVTKDAGLGSRREDPRVASLRDEIAREKAASASFQQLLRREMARCRDDDAPLF